MDNTDELSEEDEDEVVIVRDPIAMRTQLALAWGDIDLEEITANEETLYGSPEWHFTWRFKEKNMAVDYYWNDARLSFALNGYRHDIILGIVVSCSTDFQGSFRARVARFLYKMGYEPEPPEYFDQLSAHDRIELRLSMPCEFWPQQWLNEEV